MTVPQLTPPPRGHTTKIHNYMMLISAWAHQAPVAPRTSRGSTYSCQDLRLQKGLLAFSRLHLRCIAMQVRMAVLISVMRDVLLSTAARRTSKPSVRACESIESGTLMTRSIFPPRSNGKMFGSRFTSGLYTIMQDSMPPCSFNTSWVFLLAYNWKPMLLSNCAELTNSSFCCIGPMLIKMFFVGNLNPAAIILFKKASYWFTPKHATSPVDCISTPSRGSEFFNRPKEKTGTLAAMHSMSIGWMVTGLTGKPSITFVASSMKFTLYVFEMKGNDLEARRLHSMTMTSFSLHMNWMLKGPEIFNARQIFWPICFTRR